MYYLILLVKYRINHNQQAKSLFSLTAIESKKLTYIFEVGSAVTAEINRKLSFGNKSRLELFEL